MKIATALAGLALAGMSLADHLTDNGIDPNTKAAVFVLSSAGYVFALNVVENGDVYYHMNAPAEHSWMGVGFGSTMKNVRMIVSYRAENGHNLTNSCRYSHGEVEPVHDPDCELINVYTDKYGPYANTLSPQASLIAHGICKGCAVGSLNVTDTAQPFVFALGPNKTLATNDVKANLRMHEVHGSFTLDMTVATNYSGDYGRIPAPQDPTIHAGNAAGGFASYYAYDPSSSTDINWAPVAHGVVMCIAFIVIFPVGSLSLRLFKRVFIHAALQMIGLFFVVIGFALAIYLSKLYNKSKNFTSAHQIIGMLVFAALFLQVGLGLVHHCVFIRTKSPSAIGKIHRILGISIIVLALANAGIGFDFAQNSNSNKPFSIVVALVGVLFLGFMAWIMWYNKQNVYKPEHSVYLPDKYGQEVPSSYELHRAPFAKMGAVQTPRTPFFGQTKYDEDDPEDYRSHVQQQQWSHGERYTDTPGSEREGPFPA